MLSRRCKSLGAGGKIRNSSIELLRIIAVFMILAHHFAIHNGFDINSLPGLGERLFFQVAMAGVGKIGVVIFFVISVWFLLDREQTLKVSFKRVWLLERELLFWSLCLVICFLCFDRSNLGAKLLVKSVAPLSFNLWWYVSSYAVFLVFLPFLSRGLRSLGRGGHLALAAVSLCLWGAWGFVPGTVSITNYAGFVYLFVLISAYKWYFQPLPTRRILICILAGAVCVALYACASVVLSLVGIHKGLFITGDFTKIPVMLIGFGLFLLFNRLSFYNGVINKVAGSSLAVYLITDYPAVRKLLWSKLFDFGNLGEGWVLILKALVILVVVYAACTLLDFIRQKLFALTVDCKRGQLFERVWDRADGLAERLRARIEALDLLLPDADSCTERVTGNRVTEARRQE